MKWPFVFKKSFKKRVALSIFLDLRFLTVQALELIKCGLKLLIGFENIFWCYQNFQYFFLHSYRSSDFAITKVVALNLITQLYIGIPPHLVIALPTIAKKK